MSRPTHVRSIQEYFQLEDQLGEGKFGKVYLASTLPRARVELDPDMPDIVAIKHIANTRQMQEYRNECQNLRVASKLESGISKYYGCYNTNFDLFIVMEYIEGEDLYSIYRSLTNREKLSIVYDLAVTLYNLHELGITHRDIKPQNIIISGGRPIYIDFGFSCNAEYFDYSCSKHMGTLRYADPSMTLKPLTWEAQVEHDWWAYATMVHLLFTGVHVFSTPAKTFADLVAGPHKINPAIDKIPLISKITRGILEHPLEASSRLKGEEVLQLFMSEDI